MNIEEYIRVSFKESNGYCFRDRIYCRDGFNVSVQGSAGHYCYPRKTQDWYISLELGYPSLEDKLILKYAENKSIPTDTVYGFVPIETVEELVNNHGGIDIFKTFKL